MQNEDKLIIKWVKMKVKTTTWNNYYSQLFPYCYLGKANSGVEIGFLVVNKIPLNCRELNDAEILQVQDYRKSNNIFPLPLEEKTNEQST